MEQVEGRGVELEQMVDAINNGLDNKISRMVKAATIHLKISNFDVTGGGSSSIPAETLEDYVLSEDLSKQLDKKSNKKDYEMLHRQLQIMNKQIKQIAVLFTLKIKRSLEANGKETQNQKQKRKSNNEIEN